MVDKEKIYVKKKNETFMEVDADSSLLYEIKEYFTFEVPGAKYHPKVKMKVWDGKITLLNLPACTMYIGLLQNLQKFCNSRHYDLIIDPTLQSKDPATPVDVFKFVMSLDIHSNKKSIKPHDYQLAAIYHAIKNKRITLLSPTASGKSLMIYSIMHWILTKSNKTTNSVLLITPNVGLVKQMYSDFDDYSYANGFDVTGNIQTISEGASKDVTKKVVISTWQAIYKQDAKWFNQFDAIIVDEVHQAAANSLRSIMEKSTNVPYRIGLTGTLSEAKTNELVITGLFGKVQRVAHTTELIEKGHISNVDINCIVLKYQDKEEQKLIKNADYHGELEYICGHEKRNQLLTKMAIESKGNTLVLFTYVDKHGKIIYDSIKTALGDSKRKVFFIHGAVDGNERDEIRSIVEKENDAIIVASYGTLAVGTNVKRLHNIIAASPTKSLVRVLQSIGRGLRLADDKTKFIWFDIVDDFSGGTKKKNYAFLHFIKRLEIYSTQGFQYKIVEMKL
jgi:superfamily II DNA or RNA helicase